MYPHFIEVHSPNGETETVNIDHIICMADGVIKLSDGDDYSVRESYDELKQLIFDAGCHIQKADPRLNNKQLTLDDLKEMVGEPVWNSNSGQWGLVTVDQEKIYPGYYLRYHDATMTRFDTEDLIKFPLYRMKVPE